jgi:hypothetical protein
MEPARSPVQSVASAPPDSPLVPDSGSHPPTAGGGTVTLVILTAVAIGFPELPRVRPEHSAHPA